MNEMCVVYWQNDIDRGKLRYLEKSLSHCQLVSHKAHMHPWDW